MGQYKLIAIDLDGTLLRPDGSVSERSRAAIQLAVGAGFQVVLATGRNFTESRRIIDDVGHRDLCVFVSGAIIMDVRRGVVVHRMTMHSTLAREVSALIEALGHAALALQDHDSPVSDYIVTSDIELNDATRSWMKVTQATIEHVGRLADHPHPCTLRVGLVASRDETARIEKLLLDRFGDRVIVHSLFVPAYDVEVLEAFDPAVSKWQAVLRIARSRGITPRQIVAVGDDVNDLSMITGAGLGAAMGNAKPRVAAAAKRVLKPNTEDGLAEFLEELVCSRDR
ncbi:MAG: HAD family hydrolase [Tepidisphaerales bacterium]